MYAYLKPLFALAAVAAAAPATTQSASLSQATTIPAHAPHTADHAPVVNPGPKTDLAAVDQACFQFTSDDPNWFYANTGVWGNAAGTFGSLNGGKLCVPTDDSAGGAMFIGSKANPAGGNTKLECFFPTSGTANCDVSLVDGYSLSVSCQAGNNPTIGGDVNLWATSACPDANADAGTCPNTGGYAPSQDQVPAFFQPGIINGNNYCIWVNCSQDYFFDVSTQVNCHISAPPGPPAAAKLM